MRADSRTSSGESPVRPAQYAIGSLALSLTDSGIGAVKWHGVELLRGATYPVRDADWGTTPVEIVSETIEHAPDHLALTRSFDVLDGCLHGMFTLEAQAKGRLELRLSVKAKRPLRLCRAGFTLLHPIVGLAGEPLQVSHSDGTREATHFPRTISPSQPAYDIAGLSYVIDGCAIAIAFFGETFEMEDQRNWSDASFKTYCRPLALPYPYDVEAGATIEQSVTINLSGKPTRPASTGAGTTEISLSSRLTGEAAPAVALAVEEGWGLALPPDLAGIPAVLRLDLDDGGTLPDDLAGPLDLELITSDDLDAARAQLANFARRLDQDGVSVSHVVALPRAYLKSYQPDATWPSGATPADLVGLARTVFPGARIGGGVLTNFTELNRCRPDSGHIDFITHGSSAIVHAADDSSVFQTLEALPQIFESTRAIAPDIPYRLGLVSIGMRSNPYGAGLSDNPAGVPRTMTADDPRARTRRGAAWMVAAMAATEGFGIERIVLAAPGGPFGILEAGGMRARPSFHVVRALHRMAGRPRVEGSLNAGTIAAVSVLDGTSTRTIVTNIGDRDVTLAVGAGAHAAVLHSDSETAAAQPDWLDSAEGACDGTVRLSPFGIAFLTRPLAAAVAP